MVLAFIGTIFYFFWDLFISWIYLFIVPFLKWEMLWISVPIYLNWIFSEFFQEKHETDFGNAISNGVIALWISLDWTRLLVNQIQDGIIYLNSSTIFKLIIALGVGLYGGFIIISGMQTKRFVMFAGRIREVTYLLLMFTPIVYGYIELSWRFVLAIIIFFPLFYFLVEWLDEVIPDPMTYYQAS